MTLDLPGDERRAVLVTVFGEVSDRRFRVAVAHLAEKESLSGWVRAGKRSARTGDDSIELRAEGLGLRLERLLRWLRAGDGQRRISRIDTEHVLPEGLEGFEAL